MSDVIPSVRLAPAKIQSLRPLLALAILAGGAAGYFATTDAASAQAVADAGAELTRLLRAMALLKLLLVVGAAWLVDWRLRFPAHPALAGAYLASLAAMASGPGLVWGMAQVVPGAVLLHGGLAVMLVLFWRDKGSPAMIPARLRGRAPLHR